MGDRDSKRTGVDENLLPFPQEEDDEYLRDIQPCIVMSGSPLGGYKCYGPFDDGKIALQWAEKRAPLLGFVTIMPVRSPEEIGVHSEV